MKVLLERFKHGWRGVVTTAFVILVFSVPGTKGFLGKLVAVDASGGNNQQGNKGGNNGQNAGNNHLSSASQEQSSFGGQPDQNTTASPMNHDNSCSTGRLHSRSHHGHDRNRHSHYRPNGH